MERRREPWPRAAGSSSGDSSGPGSIGSGEGTGSGGGGEGTGSGSGDGSGAGCGDGSGVGVTGGSGGGPGIGCGGSTRAAGGDKPRSWRSRRRAKSFRTAARISSLWLCSFTARRSPWPLRLLPGRLAPQSRIRSREPETRQPLKASASRPRPDLTSSPPLHPAADQKHPDGGGVYSAERLCSDKPDAEIASRADEQMLAVWRRQQPGAHRFPR
jgi:hypothetical protein